MGLEARIWALRLGFGPQDWKLGLKSGNWATRLEIWPQDWKLGLETGNWASRLEIGPQDWKLGLETGNWASRLEMGLEKQMRVANHREYCFSPSSIQVQEGVVDFRLRQSMRRRHFRSQQKVASTSLRLRHIKSTPLIF